MRARTQYGIQRVADGQFWTGPSEDGWTADLAHAASYRYASLAIREAVIFCAVPLDGWRWIALPVADPAVEGACA